MLPYYERLGWLALEHLVLIDQPSGRLSAPLPAMVYPAACRSWFDAPLDLQSAPW
jgi:hypothetical protein